MKNKIETLLGFAVKARKIIYGWDNIEKRRGIHLIICDTNLSENTLKKIIRDSNEKTPVIISHNSLENIIYKQGVKVIAVTDKQMSEAIIKNMTDEYSFA